MNGFGGRIFNMAAHSYPKTVPQCALPTWLDAISRNLKVANLISTFACVFFLSLGIGYASVLVVTWIAMYYLVVLAWSLFYLFASFQSTLPWSHCNNEWNTPNCVDHNSRHNQDGEHNNTFQNVTSLFNLTVANVSKRVPAIQEYWE